MDTDRPYSGHIEILIFSSCVHKCIYLPGTSNSYQTALEYIAIETSWALI